MSGGDLVVLLGFHQCGEELISAVTGHAFEVVAPCRRKQTDVLPFSENPQSQLIGQFAHELFIGIRLIGSQTVIEMNQVEFMLRVYLAQHVEQRHRIRSAGNGDSNSVPGSDHGVTLDESFDFLQQD